MYGSENPYLTYESIFTNTNYPSENGYSAECPKNPSIAKIKEILKETKFNSEKTLNTENRGHVGEMEEWISQATTDNVYTGIVFFDQHPMNVIKY